MDKMMINRGISGYAGIPFWTNDLCNYWTIELWTPQQFVLFVDMDLAQDEAEDWGEQFFPGDPQTETDESLKALRNFLFDTKHLKVGVPHQLCFVHLKVTRNRIHNIHSTHKSQVTLLCSLCSVPLFHRFTRGKNWAPCENSTRHLALLSHRKMYQLPWSASSASASVISHLPSLCSASHCATVLGLREKIGGIQPETPADARSPDKNWQGSDIVWGRLRQ
jgi:hypothetical protein